MLAHDWLGLLEVGGKWAGVLDLYMEYLRQGKVVALGQF